MASCCAPGLVLIDVPRAVLVKAGQLLTVIASDLGPRCLLAPVAVCPVTTALGFGGEDENGNIRIVHCEGELQSLQNGGLGLLSAVRRDRQDDLVMHDRPQARQV